MAFVCVQDKEVVVDKAVSSEDMECRETDDYADNSKTAYREFLADLSQMTDGFKDCRYAVFDFKFTGSREGAGASKMDKIIFLQMCVQFCRDLPRNSLDFITFAKSQLCKIQTCHPRLKVHVPEQRSPR